MCGIFAYLNYLTPKSRREIIETLIKGLQRLEYRGYDSAGIGVDSPLSDGMNIIKKRGKVKALEDEIVSMEADLDFDRVHQTHVGISHTRWATHGPPNEVNSHPQRSDPTNEFIVVHNGIITNYKDIKKFLENKGYKFESETDTEIIAKLIKHLYGQHPDSSFRELVEHVIQQLEGAFSLCFKSVHFPGECVATRRGSPLLVGIKAKSRLATDHIPVLYNKDGASLDKGFSLFDEPDDKHCGVEYFFASDASAIVEHTNRVIILQDEDVAVVREGSLSLHRCEDQFPEGTRPEREITTLNLEIHQIMKGNFSTFMQKEMFEQSESVVNAMRGRVNFDTKTVVLGGLKDYLPEVRRCRRILLIGCGSSYLSAIAARQLLEEMTELPVTVDMASDVLDRRMAVFRDDMCVFISQSGETLDTLLALRYCKARGALTIGVTNGVGSSMSLESHCGIHINAGPEIGVGSTKAYTCQVLCLVLMALVIGQDRTYLHQRRSQIIDGLKNLPEQIKEILDGDDLVAELARELYLQDSMLVLGCGYNLATCLEGALKIKEIAYIHSEGVAAGELKHGHLALVDESLPVIVIATRNASYQRCMEAMEDVRKCGGKPIIVICERGDAETLRWASRSIEIPAGTVDCLQAILTMIPMQMLTYHLAVLRGCNVDFPRNLAKSVTVQ